MRSVVVVLPASMCAMMPMFRTFLRSVSTSSATGVSLESRQFVVVAGDLTRSPAVVREGLVGLGHLVHVLAPLDGRPQPVARVEDLVHEPLCHRLLAARPRVG